jgi:hypothetical protein
MMTQNLSDPTAQQSVMNALFTAFAGFTAFGAAIVAVLTSGGAVQKVAERWTARAERKYPNDRWCWLIDPLMIVPLQRLSAWRSWAMEPGSCSASCGSTPRVRSAGAGPTASAWICLRS